MLLFLLAYLGGVLTILSPCILPVLPFVFTRAGQPFVRSGLPLLAGMAATFCAVATLAAVGGGWAVGANQYGRDAALVVLALFGLTLIFPMLSARLTQPLVALGARLSQQAPGVGPDGGASVWSSIFLGVATGLLWAPCAGPILGVILTGAALEGASTRTSLLLLAYAGGSATSLAVALSVGGGVLRMLKQSLGAGEWIRRGLGVAVLAGVVAIALGLDTGLLTRLSLASTATVEQGLLDRSASMTNLPAATDLASLPDGPLPVEGRMPSLSGAVTWLNSPPLTAEGLKGKVVVVDFWTYSCINCLRALPYVRAWAEKYRDQGLVVIGVHAPEFAFEKDLNNVRKAVRDYGVTYPVAVDNDFAIWRDFGNHYWPAHYFVDASGQIRFHHFGEGNYDESERVIQRLLEEAGHTRVATDVVSVSAAGVEAASVVTAVASPETYIGYLRAERFISPGGFEHGVAKRYVTDQPPRLNEWGLTGRWTVDLEHATLKDAGGGITYRFRARDLHLVLGPADGHPVRFRVTIDGQAPGDQHGVDVDANGDGVVTGQRLYQLIRQDGAASERLFEIRFLDRGVEAYAFTFG